MMLPGVQASFHWVFWHCIGVVCSFPSYFSPLSRTSSGHCKSKNQSKEADSAWALILNLNQGKYFYFRDICRQCLGDNLEKRRCHRSASDALNASEYLSMHRTFLQPPLQFHKKIMWRLRNLILAVTQGDSNNIVWTRFSVFFWCSKKKKEGGAGGIV